MQSRDFCYWLQGYFEILNASSNRAPEGLTEGQIEVIKRHLNMVFIHEIDPSMGGKAHQDKLNTIHGGTSTTVFPNQPLMRC